MNFCSSKCSGAFRSSLVTKWGKNPDLEKRRAYFRDYVSKNREHLYAQASQWAKNNRPIRNRLQQLRRAGGAITKDQWAEILARFGGKCASCGTSKRIEMDHIVPVILGGKTEPCNLQPLCRTCNASKGGKLAVQHKITILET